MNNRLAPTLGIIDDFDRPEPRMIVVKFGLIDAPSFRYINPIVRQPRHEMTGRLFTPLSMFGVKAGLAGGRMVVDRVGDSFAVYPDGLPRHWQAGDGITVGIRPALFSYVRRALREACET